LRGIPVRRPDAERMSQVSLASVSRPATGRRGSIEVGVEHAVIMEKTKIYSMINKIQKPL